MVKPGDPILPKITAAWFNKLETLHRKQGVRNLSNSTNNSTILVAGATNTDIWKPVILGEAVLQANSSGIVISQASFAPSEDCWAVMQEPLIASQLGIALISGITWINMGNHYPGNRYINLEDGVFVFSNRGKATVITSYIDEDTNDTWALCVLGTRTQRPGIVDIRVTDTIFEYTYDNEIWIPWHHGVECEIMS